MTKVQVKNNIFYYELSSKPNVDIIGITVYMYKRNNFEAIFTSNYFLNIQDSIGKGFGFQEIEYSMVVNYYFEPRRTNRPHATPNYVTLVNQSLKFVTTDRHIFSSKRLIYE